MPDETIVIDGSEGEGGGQILRSSLALSAITGRALRIVKIRARRRRPGLMRQHLTAVQAVAALTRAELRGAELRSTELEFRPGPVEHGDHHFAVGTAGSATLVFQTVLWPLCATPGRSRIVFEGGTHNPMAPPFDFLDRAFLPLVRELGVVVEARLEQAGFYPAGGGRFVVELEGGHPLAALDLRSRGKILARRARALVANLPRRIGERELAVVRRELGWSREECRVVELEGRGPGNALCLELEAESVTEVVTAFGEKGVPAEEVATRAARELQIWLATDVPVGTHLADQLLLPLALAATEGQVSTFATVAPSLHTRTNAGIIARFLPVRFEIGAPDERGRVQIKCQP